MIDKDKVSNEQGSEEFTKFKQAMEQIVAVRKANIVDELPKMFPERKPTKKATPKEKCNY